MARAKATDIDPEMREPSAEDPEHIQPFAILAFDPHQSNPSAAASA